MTIRYYVHAWQGLLMFLAGLVAVLASFAGYIQSGGGDELLHRALAHYSNGKASFDSITPVWSKGELVVRNLSYKPLVWPEEKPVVHISGLEVDTMTIRMDVSLWPPRVDSITFAGV